MNASAISLTWVDPAGVEQGPCVIEPSTLNEADRERRRLVRVGCTSVRVLTDLAALPGSGVRKPKLTLVQGGAS